MPYFCLPHTANSLMHVVYSHMLYVTFCCLTGFWLCISLCHIYFVFKFSWIQELTNFVMWWLDWFMTLSSQLHQRHQCSLSIASIMLNTSNEIKKLMATKDWQSCCWSRGFFFVAGIFICLCAMCLWHVCAIHWIHIDWVERGGRTGTCWCDRCSWPLPATL